jgi:DNA-binding FadR family transcriptional regulator
MTDESARHVRIERLQPSALHLRIQDQIRRYIVHNRLRPGDRLPTEDALAGQLGASRTAVREALRSLEAVGVITTRQGSGRYVGAFDLRALVRGLSYALVFDAASIQELLQVRRALEGSFLGAALRTLDRDALGEMDALVAAMRARATRGALFIAEDRAFHLVLFRGLHNRVLNTLLDAFWSLFETSLAEPLRRSTDLLRTVRHHAAIVRALRGGNLARARAALERHFDDVEGRLTGRPVTHPLERLS